MKIFFYDTKIGRVGIVDTNNYITNLFFDSVEYLDTYEIEETKLIKQAYNQLNQYLNGNRKSFTIPLKPDGTPFRKMVWKSLEKIPYGETRSYKEISLDINNKNACRAVGQANNKNPIPIFIPCHRVIGNNGKLVGYGGGLDLKIFLLELEKKHI